jgi:hypothetical protein
MLVQLGATGVHDIFSGTDNFLLAQEPNADPEKLIFRLGERFGRPSCSAVRFSEN